MPASKKHKKTHSKTLSSERINQKKAPHFNPRDNLTEDQIEALNKLRDNLEESGLHEYEKYFCDDVTLIRYLIARDWNVGKSEKMLRESLEWRKRIKPELISAKELYDEASPGKMYLNGFDKQGRPILYCRPALDRTNDEKLGMKLLIYTLERATRVMGEGVTQMTWILDFSGFSIRNAPGTSYCLECVTTLSNHYPERLGTAFIVDTPWYFNMFWKAVSIALNPKTREKTIFVSGDVETKRKVFEKYIDLDVLEKMYGGNNEFKYNHEKIWGALVREDEKRIKKFKEKFSEYVNM